MTTSTTHGEGFTSLSKIVRDTANALRLVYAYDEIGEPIIPGKRGHLYLDNNQWRWALVPPQGHAPWGGRILAKAKLDPRLTLLVEGDTEAIFAINNTDDLKDIALKSCKCRMRRQMSPDQRVAAIIRGRENLRRIHESNRRASQEHQEASITPECDTNDTDDAK